MQSRIYCFDRYIIDPTRHEFWDGKEQVSLPLKVFEVITYLLEHRNRAVCRDELISAVWGRVDVSGNTLNQIVYRARQAVGDCNNQQRVIRTVSHFGYCWVQPIEESSVELTLNGNGGVNGHAAETGAAGADMESAVNPSIHANGHVTETPGSESVPVQPPAGEPPRWRKAAHWLAPALAMAMLVTAVAFRPDSRDQATFEAARDQIALVLPVTVLGEENEAWIRLGVMDLIADRLREAGQAVVPSDNTVALVQGLNSDQEPGPDEIARLARTATASVVMRPLAERINSQWRVTLQTAHGFDIPLVADGEGADVIAAARAATDRITLMLGYPMLASHAPSGEPALDLLFQQVTAAMLSDQFDLARTLLDHADPEHRSDPRVRYQMANIELRAGQPADARIAFESLVHDVPAAADPLTHAQALYGLGDTHGRLLDYAASEENFSSTIQVLEDAATHGYRVNQLLGLALMGRGAIRAYQGEMGTAQADYARARIVLESTGDQLSLAKLDGNMALFLSQSGRYTEAIAHADRTVVRLAQFGDVQNELRARLLLVGAHLNTLDEAGALAATDGLDDLMARLDNPLLEESATTLRTAVLLANGRLTEAERFLDHIRDTALDLPPMQVQRVDGYRAQHALWAGDAARAEKYAAAAVQHQWDPALNGELAQVWLVLLGARHQLGQSEQAVQTMAAATTWSETVQNNQEVDLFMTLMQAEHAAFADDVEAARSSFEQALARADESRVPAQMLNAAEAYALWLIRQNELRHASAVAGRVGHLSDSSYRAALLQVRVHHALGEATGWRLALDRARFLAGEREIPPELLARPHPQPRAPLQRDESRESAFAAADHSGGQELEQ